MISRKTEQTIQLIFVLTMLITGSSGIVALFLGAIGPALGLLVIAAISYYFSDLGAV
jgi:hypothetical protein